MAEKVFKRIDWLLVFFIIPIIAGGLVTMKSFAALESGGDFFSRQIIWVALSLAVFFIFSFIDFRFLKRTNVLVFLFLVMCAALLTLVVWGSISSGSKSWFNLGLFSFQPVDMMKLVLILVLAKYFSRRHVEIKDVKHIFISGLYALVPLILVLLQPDFGSAMIILFIWLAMVLVSGISRPHLFLVLAAGVVIFTTLWFFAFAPYQKARISNFINPLADIHGTGYVIVTFGSAGAGEDTIAAGATQEYTLKARATNFSYISTVGTDSVSVSLDEDTSAETSATGYGGSYIHVGTVVLAGIYDCVTGRTTAAAASFTGVPNFIWSDHTANYPYIHSATSNTSSSDWHNGYKVLGLPLPTQSVNGQ